MFYLGRFGVDIFFMITAYLFWGKIRNRESIDWIDLYTGRFFRIVPLATLSSVISIFLLWVYFGYPRFDSKIISSILSWFDAGVFDIKPPVNEFTRPRVVTSGVTWTLRWEWAFYFSLPILFFFRKRGLELAVGSMFVILYLLPQFEQASPYLVSCFAFGVLVKEIEDKVNITEKTADFIILSVVIFLFIVKPNPLSLSFTPALAIILLMVCKGGGVLGVIKNKGFIRLGHASYSIYLLQGFVFFIACKFIDENSLKSSNVTFYLSMTLSFIFLCVLSSLTFHLVERKFINIYRKNKVKSKTLTNPA